MLSYKSWLGLGLGSGLALRYFFTVRVRFRISVMATVSCGALSYSGPSALRYGGHALAK